MVFLNNFVVTKVDATVTLYVSVITLSSSIIFFIVQEVVTMVLLLESVYAYVFFSVSSGRLSHRQQVEDSAAM